MSNKLITLSTAIHDSVWLYERLAYACEGDAIVLLSDGVNDLHSPISLASFLAKAHASGVEVHAVREDLLTRGIECKYESVELIDYAEFVDLAIKFDTQVAW